MPSLNPIPVSSFRSVTDLCEYIENVIEWYSENTTVSESFEHLGQFMDYYLTPDEQVDVVDHDDLLIALSGRYF